MPDIEVDVLVVGGGLGGVAAALAAKQEEAQVLLIEETAWIGGQLTGQGVCTPDERDDSVETYGSTRSYQDVRNLIRKWYRDHTTLSPLGKSANPLNIGQCWVNTGFATEAKVAAHVLEEMLDNAGVELKLNTRATAGHLEGRKVESVSIEGPQGTSTVKAKFILDATETGDLLPLFGLPYRIGAEAKSETGEENAPRYARPDWIQPVTYPFTLIKRPYGENHTIPEPPNYNWIKYAQRFSMEDHVIHAMTTNGYPCWTYRRVIYSSYFEDLRYEFEQSNINVISNDYVCGIYPDDSNPGNNGTALKDAREASLAYIYWLQTEAPRDDGKAGPGWPELMPDKDFWDTPDGISPLPYIRESRRIDPLFLIRQQHLDQSNCPGPRATLFKDSCGIGNYSIDVHQGANGMPEVKVVTNPYQIPIGALISKDCDNLLAAGKCLGVTHITNGCYRLHPQEWNIGEAAGTLATFCIQQGALASQVLAEDPLLAGYQGKLLKHGVPLFWWSDVFGDPAWPAIQMCGTRGAFTGEPGSLEFSPEREFTKDDQLAMEARLGTEINWPSGSITRAKAAISIAETMGWWKDDL